MRPNVFRFAFKEGADMQEVEETLLLAILAVGCLLGEPAIRLEAGYAVDSVKRLVAVDAATDTGRAVARVFTGLCIHEFGDGEFVVCRANDPLPSTPKQARATAPNCPTPPSGNPSSGSVNGTAAAGYGPRSPR